MQRMRLYVALLSRIADNDIELKNLNYYFHQ